MHKLVDVKTEYEKNKNLKHRDVKLFLDWAHKQPHLPKINEQQAILFLQSCYYSNEAAKTALDTYFTVKTLCPDVFGRKNPSHPQVSEIMKIAVFRILPKPTPEGYTILYMKFTSTNPETFVFADFIRLFDMATMMHMYLKGTSKGHLIVMDMDGVVFGHFTRAGPITMKKLLFYLQDAMPVRLKGLHFVNIVSWMDKVLALMKPFMRKELMSMLYTHNTVEELKKFIPQDCLPADYGGSIESISGLQAKMTEDVSSNADLFEWEDTFQVDESKRPGRPKNVGDFFGVEGTFKRLEID